MDRVTLPVSAPVFDAQPESEKPVPGNNSVRQPIDGAANTEGIESIEHTASSVRQPDTGSLQEKIRQLEFQLSEKDEQLKVLQEQVAEQQAFESLNNLSGSLHQSVEAGLNDIASQASDVVLAALVKLLGQSLIRPEAALGAVKQVLNMENPAQIKRVLVSPTDLAHIEKYKKQLGFDERLHFIADEKIKTGGCILELESGVLDGRIDVQLKSLHELLKGTHVE